MSEKTENSREGGKNTARRRKTEFTGILSEKPETGRETVFFALKTASERKERGAA